MDVTALATSLSGASAARVQLEVSTAVLGSAMRTSADAALQLVAAMTASNPAPAIPAGLTYSPGGLSAAPGRVIATL